MGLSSLMNSVVFIVEHSDMIASSVLFGCLLVGSQSRSSVSPINIMAITTSLLIILLRVVWRLIVTYGTSFIGWTQLALFFLSTALYLVGTLPFQTHAIILNSNQQQQQQQQQQRSHDTVATTIPPPSPTPTPGEMMANNEKREEEWMIVDVCHSINLLIVVLQIIASVVNVVSPHDGSGHVAHITSKSSPSSSTIKSD